MSQDSRQRFEEWAEANCMDTKDSIIEGCYCEVETQLAWDAWQASRAAVVVQLPHQYPSGEFDGDVREAIEAAGVKVAP